MVIFGWSEVHFNPGNSCHLFASPPISIHQRLKLLRSMPSLAAIHFTRTIDLGRPTRWFR
jgi:hypothetical protein